MCHSEKLNFKDTVIPGMRLGPGAENWNHLAVEVHGIHIGLIKFFLSPAIN